MSEAENISQEQGPIPVPPPTAAGMPTVPETTIIGMAPGPADLRMIVGESDFEMAATATRSPNDPLAQGESVNVATRINDRYRLKRLLGRGGYATVYEAWDEVLRRTVAIKVPRRERFSSRRQLDEFLTEAQTAARLKHRLIVTVHDVGWTPEGACFIVLDYVDGGTLTQALGKRRFTPHHAARLLADVAEAVSYANQQGLVHRDLKPSNILLDAAGQPYVADFGLATCDESPPLSSGEVVGTPPFMAPEQVRGENHRIDGRTDLWSLGVILYVLLTGRLPFEKEGEDYFQAILHREPIHPRRIDSQVPRELDRICMRCLAKRMTDRYATVADFAEELRSWLDGRTADDARPDIVVGESLAPDAEVSGLRRRSNRSLPRVRVVPKGLRSFGSPDADFFLELLPGPRDGDGLPESLRFWKQVFESTQPDNTSAVGLLYGPSGCGKSSFLKAGLIPRLAPFVVPLYVEATPDDFETRLLARLRREFPGLRADGGLAECWLALRDGGVLPPERKLVVIIDQFEQWLHAHRHEEDTELLRALRHCDGTRVQCLLAIRDDFGMAATRFMGDLEIPIVQGRNFATVDRFNPAHARKVLSDFGRAFGQLSGADSTWTAAEERFLEQAVESLMEDGKVIPVRLALFAEMVKDRDWNPQTLATMGGAEGVGVAFLEETFVSRSANPSHRRHHEAARRILGSLLPEQGTDIRGARVGVQQLRESSGYAERPRDFDDVLRILDSDLRLITPVEDQESAPGSEPPGAATAAIRQEPSYQLTHDYLVPSIRTWLTRAQRQTRRGRIELQLAEQAALWTVKPVSGLLPSGWIWLNALFLPRRPGAGEAQRRMMRAANRHYAILFAAAAVLLIAAATGTSWVRRQMATTADATHSRQLVQRLLADSDWRIGPDLVVARLRTDLVRPQHAYPVRHTERVGVSPANGPRQVRPGG
jgi:serine/threonine protein kinase